MKNPPSYSFSLSLLMLLTLLWMVTTSPRSFAEEQPLDRIKATVNQSVITENQLNIAVSDTLKGLRATGSEIPPQAILRKQVLAQLIDTRLTLQAAEEAHITVDEVDIKKAVNQVAAQNNLSQEMLYQKIREQGIDITRWKKEIQNQLLIQKTQQLQVAPSITISQEEIDAYAKTLALPDPALREYHVRDLLVPLSDNASLLEKNTAQKQAEKLIHQLRHNQKIDITQITIHDRGWENKRQMPDVLAKHILHLKHHTFSDPILTGNGYHILYMAGIREQSGHTVPSSASIRKKLFEEKYEAGVKKWISLLRSRATIQIQGSDPQSV